MESTADVDKKQVVLKLATGVTGGLLGLASISQVMSGAEYQTQLFMCVYLTVFACIMIVTEFSPLILEDFLINFFPFLGNIKGKAIFYGILGTFCFDPTFNFLGHIAGIFCVAICALWLLYDWVYFSQPRSQIESGFQGYYNNYKANFENVENSLDRSHISEYSMQAIQEQKSKNVEYQPPDLA